MFSIDVVALSAHVGNLVQALYRLERLNQAGDLSAEIASVAGAKPLSRCPTATAAIRKRFASTMISCQNFVMRLGPPLRRPCGKRPTGRCVDHGLISA
jgi:hypothetical protein